MVVIFYFPGCIATISPMATLHSSLPGGRHGAVRYGTFQNVTDLLTYFLSALPILKRHMKNSVNMKPVALVILALSNMLPQTQNEQPDSWKITWNKKVILQTSKSDEVANICKIKSADLNKNYVLEIVYKEADAKKEKEWNRSFLFFDESDNEISKKDSTRHAKITAAELKKLFGDKKKIKIYTIAVPSDPGLAARVRVRRVHLCTLEVQ